MQTHGAGRYDELCTHARVNANARGACVLIIDGEKGHGFSAQGDYESLARLPALLERLAQQVREDLKNKAADA